MKVKTKKSVLRRVKITGTGKILHASNSKRHLHRNKSKKQLRQLAGDKAFSKAYGLKIKKLLGVA